MTLETKVRSALTVVMLVAIGIVYTWQWHTIAPLFAMACSLMGFIGGLYHRRHRPQPGPTDIEADWSRRVQAGTFLDTMQFFVPILMLVSLVIGWAHETAPLVYLAALMVLAGVDYGLRYWLLRIKEQW
ncbi:hypothetical protein GCM10027215_18030 [Nocardioides zeae]